MLTREAVYEGTAELKSPTRPEVKSATIHIPGVTFMGKKLKNCGE